MVQKNQDQMVGGTEQGPCEALVTSRHSWSSVDNHRGRTGFQVMTRTHAVGKLAGKKGWFLSSV